jgi:hypothetical protein
LRLNGMFPMITPAAEYPHTRSWARYLHDSARIRRTEM